MLQKNFVNFFFLRMLKIQVPMGKKVGCVKWFKIIYSTPNTIISRTSLKLWLRKRLYEFYKRLSTFIAAQYELMSMYKWQISNFHYRQEYVSAFLHIGIVNTFHFTQQDSPVLNSVVFYSISSKISSIFHKDLFLKLFSKHATKSDMEARSFQRCFVSSPWGNDKFSGV